MTLDQMQLFGNPLPEDIEKAKGVGTLNGPTGSSANGWPLESCPFREKRLN